MHTSLPHSETSHAANPSGAVNRLPRIPLRNRFATAAVAAAIAVIPLGAATTIATAAEHPVRQSPHPPSPAIAVTTVTAPATTDNATNGKNAGTRA